MTRSSAERCTPKERAAIIAAQNGLCGCGCGQPLIEGQIDMEHTLPNAIKKGKPDSAWLRSCHAKKTPGDRKIISKAKRRAGEHGQQARLRRRKSQGLGSKLQGRKTLTTPPGYKYRWASRKLETRKSQ